MSSRLLFPQSDPRPHRPFEEGHGYRFLGDQRPSTQAPPPLPGGERLSRRFGDLPGHHQPSQQPSPQVRASCLLKKVPAKRPAVSLTPVLSFCPCSFANLGIQCVRRKELDISLQKRRSQNIDPFQSEWSKSPTSNEFHRSSGSDASLVSSHPQPGTPKALRTWT